MCVNIKLLVLTVRFIIGLAVDYKQHIGFHGQLLIEPKPREPTKHQYDFDSATGTRYKDTHVHTYAHTHTYAHAHMCLQHIGLHVQLLIEPNHREPTKHQYYLTLYSLK